MDKIWLAFSQNIIDRTARYSVPSKHYLKDADSAQRVPAGSLYEATKLFTKPILEGRKAPG